jgi:predicted permease
MAPSRLRDRWREEWLGEIDRQAPKGAPSPLVRALGAPIDAIRAPRSAGPTPGPAFEGSSVHRPPRVVGRHSLPGLLDFRSALRANLASPIVSITAVLALGVGIALATAAFTVVSGVVDGRLEAPGGDQILALRDSDTVGRWGLLITLEEHERRRRALASYVDVAAYRVRTDDTTLEGEHQIRRITVVTWNLFSVLGVNPTAGRTFAATDGEAGAVPVALVSELVARAHGLTPARAVGRRLDVRGRRYDIVGVIPESCRFPFVTDIWVPFAADMPATADDQEVSVVARARPGLDLQAATAELRVIAAQAPRDPREHRDQRVVPFTTILGNGEEAGIAWAIVGALVLLLLVAAANVANLMLARSAARQRDLAIRSALGASRGRIVAALAIEAALLAAVAAGLGLAGARVALTIFRSMADDLPYWISLDLDLQVFGFAVLVGVIASFIAGVAPALKVTRGTVVDTLRTGHATMRFGRLSAAITIVEAAIAVGLLTGAASFAQALVGFGYQSFQLPEDRVAIAQIYFAAPPELSRPTLSRNEHEVLWRAFHGRIQQDQRTLTERISTLPGVSHLAWGWHFPGSDRRNRPFEIQGGPVTGGLQTRFANAGTSFFAVLGARPLAGRDFTQDDVDNERQVVIVNEPFAKKYFGDVNPIGRRLRLPTVNEGEWREIVGVVPDVGLNPGDASRADGVYIPLEASNVLRVAWLTDGNPLALAPAIHEAVRQLPLQPRVQWTHTLADNLAQSASIFRGFGYGLVALGGVALILTCTAIHAIVAFSLAQRRRELAVRLALGAGGRGVVGALLGRTARQLAAGAILGAGLALVINQLIDQLPMDVPRAGIWRPAGTMAVIMIAGLSACAGPLRRALALKPLDWLKGE